jgi:hypothetical protein
MKSMTLVAGRFFADRPKELIDRLRTYWEEWRAESEQTLAAV